MIKIRAEIGRKVELLNYTDFDVIGKAREFYARVKAENPEFNLMWEEFYKTIKNTFILEADEDGLARWEEMLGIIPSGSLEDRRLKVFLEWNSNVIWTDRTLRSFLNLFLGENTYELNFIYNKYALKIKLYFGSTKVNATTLLNELKSIIPANIAVFATLEVKFSKYWAGARRRVLYAKYREYEPTDEKGELKKIFAGRLISVIRREWPIIPEAEFVPKGLSGQLLVDGEYMRGVFR
ncbi:MAG: putative phage tail protein [Ezakiella sp.]|nr:putative phage tail protein [Ezakiella sp.]